MKPTGITLLNGGTHRGANALIRATTDDVARLIARWAFVDLKPGRAEEAAVFARERFPRIRTAAAVGDGVSAALEAGAQVLVAATMDSGDATIDIVEQRPLGRTLFQLVGRGPGGSTTGSRFGIAGCMTDENTRGEALLFLQGLRSLTSRDVTTSGALTRGGDPLTATLLGPMRDATAMQSARYIGDIARGRSVSDAPLMFFTAGAQYPLAVIGDADEPDSRRRELALHLASRFPVPRDGNAVDVAFVNLADRAIRMFFIERTNRDARRVSGITEWRVPKRRIVPPAMLSD